MSSGDVAEALNIDVDTVRVIGKAIRKQLDDESHFSM
jgi:DNA-binding CsgD family transcriptional regulator